MHEVDLLANIGLSIVVATAVALLAKALKQPLLLAYLVAGIIIGPEIGFGWVKDKESIKLISEIGLILLLFIIGLEIDLKKLIASGRSLIISGISQFLICVVLGLGFSLFLGFEIGGGKFDALYLAVGMALSSTMIVVKLLYDKFELSTLPGRITLGILIFQDIWAILFLAIQPNLLNPEVITIVKSFIKGFGLVIFSIAASKYLLPRVFEFIAKIPELLLVTAVAWCFLISGIAGAIGLSREMGALIAGVSLSTFPYNIDVIAKVINIRDFFVTLFFVGLGLQIPKPTISLLIYAAGASVFLIATRFLSIFPILYSLKNGLRGSLIPSLNLAQMSEFSLVIASLGLALNHINSQVVGIFIFMFAITSVLSTYMINYNHEIQENLSKFLRKIGMKDIQDTPDSQDGEEKHRSIIFLGFFREASSILYELESQAAGTADKKITDEIMVIDFNPQVYDELNRRSIKCIYGDISSLDTLQHAHIEDAKVVVSSIEDSVLRGTTNLKLMRMIKRLCPITQVMVTANSIQAAIELYREGADFVFIPRLHAASQMARIISDSLKKGFQTSMEREIKNLMERREVLP
ncbi:MAG: cation:proton antiporter [Thermodesulfobacteriota bacterium]|nr:cation:proton antiporter [Thermodesulfobacteriota bacterium]